MRNPTLVSNHSGSIETCERLQRGARYFRRKLTATTLDIARDLGAASPRDLVRGLRCNGMNIVTEFDRTTPNGSRVFRFTLM